MRIRDMLKMFAWALLFGAVNSTIITLLVLFCKR